MCAKVMGEKLPQATRITGCLAGSRRRLILLACSVYVDWEEEAMLSKFGVDRGVTEG